MWDQRYEEEGFAYGSEPNDFLRSEYARVPKGGRVLCLAEGEGRNAVFLAARGYSVTAVDQSAVGLEKAQRLALQHGVEITTEIADLADYDMGQEAWDGIVSIWAHVPSAIRRELHAKVGPGLRPGGVFLLEAYTEDQLAMSGRGGPPPAQRDLFMSLGDLAIELKELDLIQGSELTRDISEGKYHRGVSAVVQFIGGKAAHGAG